MSAYGKIPWSSGTDPYGHFSKTDTEKSDAKIGPMTKDQQPCPLWFEILIIVSSTVWDDCSLFMNRSAYYNADTADLEIGQEFEDAEAEEEAALELQRASYKRLDPADFGEEDDGEGHEVSQATGKGQGKDRRGSDAAGSTRNGAALLSMKSDLEQLALGSSGEVGTSWAFVVFLVVGMRGWETYVGQERLY